MSIEQVKEYFQEFRIDGRIQEFVESSATVDEAAAAVGVIPARIAKTLSFKEEDTAILVVTAGDMKIDNKKFKTRFGYKAKMLSPDEVLHFTGHAIGGVCPFGLRNKLDVYLDESLKRFETVFPACGSSHSAIELSLDELQTYSKATDWVDVCK
ncbi:YbaK/EbsC family protein [Bacillus sp. 1P06AnD]|uniref:YbaK/EbsC family protein n=1 Tax=Bacillus sp. 1P06AnD TaxID=3132208 RepID=UPI0039A379A7